MPPKKHNPYTLDQTIDTCTLALRVGYKKSYYPNNIIIKSKLEGKHANYEVLMPLESPW
jgi:hypothetical protein